MSTFQIDFGEAEQSPNRRDRPRHHQQPGRRDGADRPAHPHRGIVPSVVSVTAVRRSHRRRRSPRDADHASRAHRLFGKTPDGPRRRRRPGRTEAVPVPLGGRQRLRSSSCNWATKVLTPPEVSAHILRKLKLDAEAALGRTSHAGRHHGSRLFQRRAAPGHQRRRPHRGTRSSAPGE